MSNKSKFVEYIIAYKGIAEFGNIYLGGFYLVYIFLHFFSQKNPTHKTFKESNYINKERILYRK